MIDVFEKSGNPELVKEHGDWFSYDKTPRALIFARDAPQVLQNHFFLSFIETAAPVFQMLVTSRILIFLFNLALLLSL